MKDHLNNLQDQHMDELIRLAFKYEDELVVQTLVTLENADTEEEILPDQRLMDIAWQKFDQEEKRLQKKARRNTIRHMLPRIIEVAACIILILSIAAPIAFANNTYFRSKVMQFLLTFNENEGFAEIHFNELEEAAFSVPVEWCGTYHPSLIPADFTVIYHDSWDDVYFEIQYENPQGKRIRFIETNGMSAGMVGTENAELSHVDVNGTSALIVSALDKEYIQVEWSCEASWLTLITEGIPYDETISLLQSVRRIIK